MANETIRTKAALLVLLADNTTGDISPLDIRDMLVSLMGVYGGIKVDTGVTGQTLAAAVPEILTEWTGNGISTGATPDYVNDKITVDNAGDYEVFFHASFNGITGAVFHFELYKDGVSAGPACSIKTTNNDTQAASFSDVLTLSPTNRMEIFVTSDTNGTMTLVHSNFGIKRIG